MVGPMMSEELAETADSSCRRNQNPFSSLRCFWLWVAALASLTLIACNPSSYSTPSFRATLLAYEAVKANQINIMSSRTEPQAEGGPLRNKVMGFMGFGLAVRALQLGIQGVPLRYGKSESHS